MLRKTLCLALALTAGCSSANNNDTGSKIVPPLTPEQSARFQQTRSAIGEATDWQQNRTSAASINGAPAPSRKPQVEHEVGQNCQFEVVQPLPDNADGTGIPKKWSGRSGMNIAGPNCPIQFGWLLNQSFDTEAQTSANAFKMKYAAVKDVAKLIDVLSYTVEYNENTTHTGLNGSGTGLIESKSQGNIKLELTAVGSGDEKGAAIIRTTRFVYPDGLIVELKDVTAYAPNQDPKAQYFINNTTVSEREYKEAMQSLGLNKAARD